MSKKAFVVILVLSIMVTITVPLIGFMSANYKIASGFPLRFTGFSFLGSSTDYSMLILDIIFWFVITWGVWKLLKMVLRR